MRTLLDAADSACVTRRKPSRPTQPYCSRSCSICLRRLGALRFSSHAVSDCRPILAAGWYTTHEEKHSPRQIHPARRRTAHTAHPYSSGYTLSRSSPLHLLKCSFRYCLAFLNRTPERAGAEGRAKRLVKHIAECCRIRMRLESPSD